MKYRLKTALALICLTALLLSMTSCGPAIPDMSTRAAEESIAEDSESPDTRPVTIPSVRAEIAGNHINMVIDDNFIVDGDYSAPDQTEAESIKCNFKPVDERKLINVFFDGDKPKSKDGSIGKALVSDVNEVEYYSDDTGSAIRYQRFDFKRYEKFFAALDEEKFLAQIDIEKIPSCGELEFMSSSDALELVNKKIEELGIETAGKPVIEAYDLETLESLAKKGESQINRSSEYLKYKYTKEDEIYYFTIQNAVGSIPVTASYYDGTKIVAAVSSKGLEYLEARDILQKVGRGVSKTVIPAESILQDVYNFCSGQIKPDMKINVTEVSLQYMRETEDPDKGIELLPVWVIKMVIKPGTDNEDSAYAIFGTDGNLMQMPAEF